MKRNPADVEFSLSGPLVRKDSKDRIVKGFMSTSTQDREKDVVPPEAFDLKAFRQIRTLLHQHAMWRDENGNKTPIGEVTLITLAKLVDIGEEDFWGVRDLETMQLIDTFPKDRVPNMVAGDRGIWTNARVDVDEVWDKVERRLLNGFSWRGVAREVAAKVGGLLKKISDKVDMHEVSLVYSPMQSDALLMVKSKSAADDTAFDLLGNTQEPRLLYSLAFSPALFDEDKARAWLEAHGFDASGTPQVSCDKELIFVQAEGSLFDPSSLRSMRVVKGVQAFVGLPLSEKIEASEKNAIFALTLKLMGCSVPSEDPETNTEDSMKGKAKQKEAPETEPKVGVTTPVAETPAPAESSETPKTESPKVDTSAVSPAAESAAPVVQAESPVVEPAKSGALPIVKEDRPAPVSEEKPAEKPPVETPSTPKAETPAEQTKRLLSDEAILDKVVSQVSTQVVQSMREELKASNSVISSTIENFVAAAGKLSKLIEAQANAVVEVVPKVGAAPAAGKEGSQGTEAKEKSVKEDESKEELLSQMAALARRVRAMEKSAISEPEREEPKEKSVKTQGTSPNDVFPVGWPFRSR